MNFQYLAKLACGHMEARAVQVAVSLGIFDAVEDRGKDARTVAAILGADVRGTEVLLNALTALDLLKKDSGLFSLNPTYSCYLTRSSATYLGDMILFEASLWSSWGELAAAVRSGKPVRSANMYQEKPAETEIFINAMHSLVRARGDAEILADKLDWSEVTELLDLGSGPGTYPLSLLARHPKLRATIFDLPGTLRITDRFVRASGLAERVRLVPGDYRMDAVPGRYQVIFASNIIHGESSDENTRLMAKLYSCLENGGKIIVKDHILDDSLTDPPAGAVFALLMLLTTERGRCYSFTEVKGWLEKAGCRQIRLIPLAAPLTSSLVIAERG